MVERYGDVALNLWMTDQMLSFAYCSKPGWESYFKLVRVLYDSESVRDKIKDLIMEAKKVNDTGYWYHLVHEIMMKCRLSLKSFEFHDEMEYRLVFYRPEKLDKGNPALDYICSSHFDVEDNGIVVEREYDPSDDQYVWVDISTLLTGVTCFNEEYDLEKLRKLAGRPFNIFTGV